MSPAEESLKTLAALTIANHVEEALEAAWIAFAMQNKEHHWLPELKAAFAQAQRDVAITDDGVILMLPGEPGDDNFLDEDLKGKTND
jgi:hypothetical protein